MYIRGDYQIFEKMIFAKVGLTLLILNKVRAQRGANDFGRGEKALSRRVFLARDNLIGGKNMLIVLDTNPLRSRIGNGRIIKS